MRVLKFLIFLSCLVPIMTGCDGPANVQDPNNSFFTKFYGLDGNQTGDDMVVLADGTFVLFGTTAPSGQGQISQWYFVRVDPRGMVLSERKFGSPSLNETASDIELTSDGNLVAVGNVYKTASDRDIRIMTLRLDLSPIDSAVLPVLDNTGVVTSGDEEAQTVTETTDGFIISGSTTYVGAKPPVAGYTDTRDGLNIRLNKNLTRYSTGGWLLTQTYGKYSDDITVRIYQLPNGSFYVFGHSDAQAPNQTAKNYNYWYYSISASGVPTNDSYLGNQATNEKLGAVVLAPPQAGSYYILSGIVFNQSGDGGISIVALKNTLQFAPSDPFFLESLSVNLGSGLVEATSVVPSALGGYYVLSNENSTVNNQNWLLTKVGNDGKLSPNFSSYPLVFGGEGPDGIGAIRESLDGRIVMIGTMRTGKPDAGETKMTLVKVNSDGKFEN